MHRRFLASFVMPMLCFVATAAGQAATQPTIEAIDRGLRQVYSDVQACTVRVVVPMQVGQHPITKWMPKLDPKVREELNKPQTQGSGTVRVFVEKPLSATQPIDVERGSASEGGGGIPITPARVVFAEFLGIVLNDQGDVLLPLYVDRNLVADHALRVTYGDNQVASAKLRGGDAHTNIAVVKLDKPVGRAMRMAEDPIALGSLVLLYAPTRRQARLVMWTGGHDEHAVVINSSGALEGFVRYGHMLEPWAFGPVAEQLIQTGAVKRAVLGVLIRDVLPNDPVRVANPTLGSRPAARVEVIDQDSAAERAGVQKGDVILSLAGKPVNDLPHFAAAITGRTGPTELRVLRDGKEHVLTVNLEIK